MRFYELVVSVEVYISSGKNALIIKGTFEDSSKSEMTQ